MAVLEQTGIGLRHPLLGRHLVGRSHLAHLHLPEPNVSGEHAVLCWTGQGWEVHDLASRNGTFVDGRRLEQGERAPLHCGARLSFGSTGPCWRLVDASPPDAMAARPGSNEMICAEAGFLPIPSPDDPVCVVYRDRHGDWVLDTDGAIERVRDGHEVVAADLRFVLHLPMTVASTVETRATRPSVTELTLRFGVSHDEEYVTLAADHARGTIDLGARAHHYLLLTLARARLYDSDRDPANAACGWVYQDELARQLGVDEKHLNIIVFRCRKHLSNAGIDSAAEIIERRKSTKQVRLGLDRIAIQRI